MESALVKGLGSRVTMRFGESERYWRVRRMFRRLYFATAGRLFSARYTTAEVFADASALRYLLAKTAIPVLVACAFIAGFALLQDPGNDLADNLNLGKLDANAYNSMLEAIASVTGVFLALYFTAVSAVAAAVYASVPHDIRALMLRDRLGNVYVAGVAFTMALSILLLLVHAAAGAAYRLALPVVAVLALFSIFAFIRLGQRAFSLYDPTRLAVVVIREFGSWFGRAKFGGWRWDVPEFQDHYRKQARRSVSTLASLMRIAADQQHLRGESNRYVIRSAVGLLASYLTGLHEVPTQSRWFGQRYEHQQWYLAGSTELEMATNTESSLQPKTVPDATWVEDALVDPLVASVKDDVRNKRLEDAYLTMELYPRLLELFGDAWATSEGLRWSKDLCDGIVDLVSGNDFKDEPRSPYLAGLLDTAAMLPMSVELGINRKIDDLDVPALGKRIRESDWSKEGTPYRFDLPSNAVRAMEEAQSGIAFEYAADAPSPTRTPGWYVEEVTFVAFEKDLKAELDSLVDSLCKWYPTAADRLLAAEKLDAAAAVLSRGLEVAWKLERHVVRWREAIEELRAEGARVDFKRPEWVWDDYDKKIRELRLGVLERLARAIPALALQERRDDVPDYFGYAVHRTGEACYDALANDDAKFFAKLFPAYFIGSLFASERVKAEVGDLFPEQALTWIFEPVLDCLDLSGYAFLYSELHQNPKLWESCKSQWDKYFAQDGRERLERLAAFSALQQSQYGLTPRSIMRTRWQMALERTLEQLPRDDEAESRHPFGHRPVKHKSRIIRRIAPDEGMLGSALIRNASDVFISMFLSKREGAEGLDFGVADWIERELLDEDGDGDGHGGNDA
jgi:hypothetical protein